MGLFLSEIHFRAITNKIAVRNTPINKKNSYNSSLHQIFERPESSSIGINGNYICKYSRRPWQYYMWNTYYPLIY